MTGITPKNILVIPLRYIGDTILTVPLLRNLHHHFPNARIDVLASKTTAPLLEPCPYIHQVLIEPSGTSARLRQIQAGHYDTGLVLRKSATTNLLCRMAGISRLIGYDKQRFPWGYKRWGWFLDASARYPSLRTEIPQAISHLQLLHLLGVETLDDHLELWHTEADLQALHEVLKAHQVQLNQPMAVLHAASASHGKTLEIQQFGSAVQALQQSGYQILCTGTTGDTPLYDTLAQSAGVPLINLAGKTRLRETYALYRQVQILLTVDSSPIHLGAAASVPHIIGVFGPTNEKQWGPHAAHSQFYPVFMDLPCRPCYAKVCSHNNCRTLMTGTQIAGAVQMAIQASATSNHVAHLE